MNARADSPPGTHSAPSADLMPRLLALASDAMVLTDGDGIIEWVNARFAQLTGHDESTALGAPLLDLLNSHQTEAPVQQLLHAALRSQSAVEGIELCHRKSSGEAFWNRVAVHPIGGAKFAFVMRDIGAERGKYSPGKAGGFRL